MRERCPPMHQVPQVAPAVNMGIDRMGKSPLLVKRLVLQFVLRSVEVLDSTETNQTKTLNVSVQCELEHPMKVKPLLFRCQLQSPPIERPGCWFIIYYVIVRKTYMYISLYIYIYILYTDSYDMCCISCWVLQCPESLRIKLQNASGAIFPAAFPVSTAAPLRGEVRDIRTARSETQRDTVQPLCEYCSNKNRN